MDDLLQNGADQIILLHDDPDWKTSLSQRSMLVNGSVSLRYGKLVSNLSGSKKEHLYSVYRSIQSRRDAGHDSLFDLQQMVSIIPFFALPQ